MTALSRNKYPSVEAENKLGHIFTFRHYHMDLPKNRTINGTWISINIVGNFRRLAMLFSILSRSHGDIYSFHTNPLLDDSVSTRCSPITCRSTLQAAAECYNTSTCLAISHKGNKGKRCMSCTCPADGAELNKNGIFYFRDVEPFSKGEAGFTFKSQMHTLLWD